MGKAHRVPKVTRVLVGIYVAVSALVFSYVSYLVNFTRPTAELVGVPLILLSLPWSLIFSRYHPRVTGSPNDPLIILAFFIAANTLILYVVGRAIEVRVRAASTLNRKGTP